MFEDVRPTQSVVSVLSPSMKLGSLEAISRSGTRPLCPRRVSSHTLIARNIHWKAYDSQVVAGQRHFYEIVYNVIHLMSVAWYSSDPRFDM